MIKIFIIDLKQDDPKKCTARRMERFGFATVTEIGRYNGGIVLSPYTERIISISDREEILNKGLWAVDGSWKNGEKIFKNIYGKFRRLPYLIAGNNINFGKPYMLSTAEAVSASLYIIGYRELAWDIMRLFSWGHTFLEMNREPLEEYYVKSEEDIRKIEKLYMP